MAIVIEEIISDFKFSLIPYFIEKSYNNSLIILHIADFEISFYSTVMTTRRFR